MKNREHLLTVVEPTPGGDSTIDLAHETVARGGVASVVMIITDRVERDIRGYAESEGIGRYEAEGVAIDQLQARYIDRIGDRTSVATHYGPIEDALKRHLAPDVTAIAVPERLMSDRSVQLLVSSSGLPVTVTPRRAA